jgi:hypothetical protein
VEDPSGDKTLKTSVDPISRRSSKLSEVAATWQDLLNDLHLPSVDQKRVQPRLISLSVREKDFSTSNCSRYLTPSPSCRSSTGSS